MGSITADAAANACTVGPGAEDNGLAVMLCDLVSQNLAATPRLWPVFRSLDTVVRIVPTDLDDVEVTLDFSRGSLTTYGADAPRRAKLTIRATADAIMGLSSVPLFLGLPDLRTGDGRGMVKDVVTRNLKVEGLLLHPDALRKVSLLLAA